MPINPRHCGQARATAPGISSLKQPGSGRPAKPTRESNMDVAFQDAGRDRREQERQRQFRDRFLAETPPWYHGALHLGFTLLPRLPQLRIFPLPVFDLARLPTIRTIPHPMRRQGRRHTGEPRELLPGRLRDRSRA